jgi:hypothetical protein
VASKRFAFVRSEHDLVATLGQLANHRLEDALVREVQRRKQDSHFRAMIRRFFP